MTAVCNSYDSFEQDYDLEDHAAELRVEETPGPHAFEVAGCEPDDETMAAARAADTSDSPYAKIVHGDENWMLDFGVAHGLLDPLYPVAAKLHNENESATRPTDGLAAELSITDGLEQPPLDHADTAPPKLRDSRLRDPDVAVPYQLTHTQYQQAKFAVAEYEKANELVHDSSRKPLPQRAAISQKAFLGLRKPPQPFRWPEDESVVAGTSVNE
jgi:hypothetical protein